MSVISWVPLMAPLGDHVCDSREPNASTPSWAGSSLTPEKTVLPAEIEIRRTCQQARNKRTAPSGVLYDETAVTRAMRLAGISKREALGLSASFTAWSG